MNKSKRYINLHVCTPIVLTSEQFESLLKLLQVKSLLGSLDPGDSIVASLLRDNTERYLEVRRLEGDE